MTPHSHHSYFSRQASPYLAALIFLALSCWLVNPAWSADGSHLLDGMSFVGKNGEVGKTLAEYEDEEIVFHDGMFTSVSCEPYNFGSGAYHAEASDGRIYFVAVTTSPTHGQITWKGVIDGVQADVTFVWTKERWYWDTRREYWFRGTLKK